jgi:hypothetical protein
LAALTVTPTNLGVTYGTATMTMPTQAPASIICIGQNAP